MADLARVRFPPTCRLVWRLLPWGLAALGARAAEAGAVEMAALAPPSGPAGAILFSMLPASETGLESRNEYDDPQMWAERYQEFTLGTMGTGVAIGDYDADGRPDLLVVSKTGPVRLFRNLGAWRFEDVTEAAGLGARRDFWSRGWRQVREWTGQASSAEEHVEHWKHGAAFADVNNDGWLDLYVCRFDAPNWLYVNQGDGTFREEGAARGVAISDSSVMASFGDYDRDGWLDLYLATNVLDIENRPGGQPDVLLRNNGDGTFRDVTVAAGIRGDSLSHSATWFDHDGDGWLDLYSARDFGAPDAFYHNQRDGTFREVINEVVPHQPYSSMGADFADVNNDGHLDLLVADMATTTHEKDQRSMAHTRTPDSAKDPEELAAPQYPRNALYLNNGAGAFLEVAQLTGVAATDWTWSVRFEDLDNDGRVDLHVTNGMIREFANADLLDRVARSERLADRFQLMKASPLWPERNLAYRNEGDLRFTPVGDAWGLAEEGISFGTAFGDLDGDGDLDLVYTNYQGELSVRRNDSPGGARTIIALRGTRSNRFGVGATVRLETAQGRQVRQLIPGRGYLSSSEPVLHFGLGAAGRIERLEVSWPSGHVQVLTDLPVNHRFVITEPAGPTTGPAPDERPGPQLVEVAAELGLALQPAPARPDRVVQPLAPRRFGRFGPALAIGDLNGDGHDDVVHGGAGGSGFDVRLATGDGRFLAAAVPAHEVPAATEMGPIALLDIDGNDTLDLLVTRGGARLPAGSPEYQPELWLNDGRADWTRAEAWRLPEYLGSAGALAVADFDRDGRLDVFVGGRVVPGRYPEPAPSALWLNRAGRLEDATTEWAAGLRQVGLVTAALATDADADGWIDLLLALEWGPVTFWRNEEGQGFRDATEDGGFAAAGSGWWSTLVGGDFNGDGRMDYLAGNVGLNTRHRASEKEPVTLLAVTPDGRRGRLPPIVEGYYEADRLVPWRTRKDLGAAVPAALRRTPDNNTYARLDLTAILGTETLQAARRYEATELRSGIFLSVEDGRWQFTPLPRLVQAAPLRGAVATDLNADGWLDLAVLQNDHSPALSTGRFDGGIGSLLWGDGRGGWFPAPGAETGWIVRGEGQALGVTDLDDDAWPDLLATRHAAPNLAWRNRGRPEADPLRIRLDGGPGNRGAAGARVTVEYQDGARQAVELQAPGGSLSAGGTATFWASRPERRIARVHVRWPGGTESIHKVNTIDRRMVLRRETP